MDNVCQKSFMLYKDWKVLFEALENDEERGELIMALFACADGGEPAGLSGAVKMAFLFMSAQIGRDREKWQETCERNAENGRRGGRPKKPGSTKKTDRFFEEPKKPDTDTNTEKETDTDTETVTATVTETEHRSGCAEKRNDRSTDMPQRAVFGSAKNVYLTPTEYEMLCREFTAEHTDVMIERLSRRIGQGASCQSCYAVLARNLLGDSDELTDKSSKNSSEWERIAQRLSIDELLGGAQSRLGGSCFRS